MVKTHCLKTVAASSGHEPAVLEAQLARAVLELCGTEYLPGKRREGLGARRHWFELVSETSLAETTRQMCAFRTHWISFFTLDVPRVLQAKKKKTKEKRKRKKWDTLHMGGDVFPVDISEDMAVNCDVSVRCFAKWRRTWKNENRFSVTWKL